MVDDAPLDGPLDAHDTVPPAPAPGGPGLVLDAADGPHPLGAPTVDSDADGHADTVLVDVPDGLLLATDLDGDAHVDATTLVGPLPATVEPPDPAWEPGWDTPAPPRPVLDPMTGAWSRMV